MSVPPLTLAMKSDEIEMLTRHLDAGITYLEFGSGGSTELALARGVGLCHSVESDPAWIGKLREIAGVRDAEAAGRLVFHLSDIGPVGDWGMPADRSRFEYWPTYFLDVWGRIGTDPDLVLIDGRFRAACGLVALSICPPTTTILVHDFFEQTLLRRNYHTLLEVADVIERATNLVSLRRKPDVSPRVSLARISTVWTDFG